MTFSTRTRELGGTLHHTSSALIITVRTPFDGMDLRYSMGARTICLYREQYCCGVFFVLSGSTHSPLGYGHCEYYLSMLRC
jgi:hypothetical protein